MSDMLTAKEMQDLLQVDRSTIYRMAEAGRLPAIKVGKQWRFPGDQVASWLKGQAAAPTSLPAANGGGGDLAPLVRDFPSAQDFAPPARDFAATLPLDCVQLIQDAFAETLGVTLITADLDGRPITQASNPFPLYQLLAQSSGGHAICQERWKELGQVPALEPRFMPALGGLLCARALVRVGNELQAMVIAFGVAPQNWPPPADVTVGLAASLALSLDDLCAALDSVFTLTPAEQKKVLVTIQRIADILAHIGNERQALLGRLANIARLSMV
jgi:excisionase family DNA binding protein